MVVINRWVITFGMLDEMELVSLIHSKNDCTNWKLSWFRLFIKKLFRPIIEFQANRVINIRASEPTTCAFSHSQEEALVGQWQFFMYSS